MDRALNIANLVLGIAMLGIWAIGYAGGWTLSGGVVSVALGIIGFAQSDD